MKNHGSKSMYRCISTLPNTLLPQATSGLTTRTTQEPKKVEEKKIEETEARRELRAENSSALENAGSANFNSDARTTVLFVRGSAQHAHFSCSSPNARNDPG